MSDDIFKRQEANINKVKNIGKFDVFGEKLTALPCDDPSTWLGNESCAKCPKPCDRKPIEIPISTREEDEKDV